MGSSTDITPKERMLKMLRQALLYQTPNKFPHLDLDSIVLSSESNFDLEEFYLRFNNEHFKSYLVASRYEAIDAVFELMQNNGWQHAFTTNNEIEQWLQELGIGSSKTGNAEVAIHRCERLISRTGTIVFSIHNSTANPFTAIKNHIVIAYNSEVQERLHAEPDGNITLMITGGANTSQNQMNIWLFIINTI